MRSRQMCVREEQPILIPRACTHMFIADRWGDIVSPAVEARWE